jgi:hypothetical protein
MIIENVRVNLNPVFTYLHLSTLCYTNQFDRKNPQIEAHSNFSAQFFYDRYVYLSVYPLYVYGQAFNFLKTEEPRSVFLAEGSEIKVKGGKRV